jgi:RimJ/RimL family protein N-acetyltransferase
MERGRRKESQMSILASVTNPSQVQFVVSSATIQLADGTAVTLRPMQPTDVTAILEMHDRLLSDTIYYRYLHPYKPTFEELDHLARLDRAMGAAFVAVIKEDEKDRVIGLGFYQTEAQNRTIGQPAFLVEDEYQNRGVGWALAGLVIQHARTSGLQVLDALIHYANRKMMRLIEKSGVPYKAKLSYGACEVRISLQDCGRLYNVSA